KMRRQLLMGERPHDCLKLGRQAAYLLDHLLSLFVRRHGVAPPCFMLPGWLVTIIPSKTVTIVVCTTHLLTAPAKNLNRKDRKDRKELENAVNDTSLRSKPGLYSTRLAPLLASDAAKSCHNSCPAPHTL